jgi:acetyl-CoA carboxylase biotin carboxyl carrier protein
MDFQKIKALLDLAAESGLSELEYEENGCRLRVSRGEAPNDGGTVISTPNANTVTGDKIAPVIVTDAPVAGQSAFLNAPMFGVFCLTPAPNEAPFVQVGDTVRKSQKLCMLEAMKQFHAVNADRDGKIVAILAENGHEVDAGQALFRFA